MRDGPFWVLRSWQGLWYRAAVLKIALQMALRKDFAELTLKILRKVY